jgi:integrase
MLGGYRLREISPALVQEFIAKLRRKGVGDPSIVKTATVLQSILNRAYLDGMIARNPVSVVRKPSQRRTREPDTIAPATVELIRRNLELRDATLVSVLAYAGLRPESEAVALKWGQVGKRTLNIHATKTGRQRHVRLLAPLAADLEEWQKASGEPTGNKLVFPASHGGWSRDDWRNWLRRIYRPAALKAGLDRTTRPRDLRGSFASLLIYEGRNVVEVAEQLGHSAQTCLRDYAGVFAEFDPDDRVSAEAAVQRAREAAKSA